MINWLRCFILGHKFVSRYFSGKTFDTHDRLTGKTVKGNFYEMRINSFCHRCGKLNREFVYNDNSSTDQNKQQSSKLTTTGKVHDKND